MLSVECTVCPNTADYKKYKTLMALRILHHYILTYIRLCYVRALPQLYCSVVVVIRHVCQRNQEVNYPSQPIAMDQATRTPKRGSDGDSSLCGPSNRLKLMTVPLTHQRTNCAKASLYKKITPCKFKLAGSPKHKAYGPRK